MTPKIIDKPKRSIKLTPKQISYLKKTVRDHASITEAGITLGISKDVLSRTLAFGSCSEKTYTRLFGSVEDMEDSRAVA